MCVSVDNGGSKATEKHVVAVCMCAFRLALSFAFDRISGGFFFVCKFICTF